MDDEATSFLQRSQIYSIRSNGMLDSGEWKKLYDDPLLFYIPLGENYWPFELIDKINRRIERGYGDPIADNPRS